MGACYYEGKGVTKDLVEAAKWFKKAAEQGHAEAQHNLAHCYQEAAGLEKNHVQAAYWFRLAAMQSQDEAQFHLGECYANGIGVPKDEVEAYAWWNLASVTHEQAKEKISALEKTLSRSEIAAGQSRTRELIKEIDSKSR